MANAARGKPDHDLAVARRLHLYVLDRYGQAELPRDDGSRSLTHDATAPVTKAVLACNRFMRYTGVIGDEPTRAVSRPRWLRVDTRFRLDTACLGCLMMKPCQTQPRHPTAWWLSISSIRSLAPTARCSWRLLVPRSSKSRSRRTAIGRARGPRFQGSDSACFVGLGLAIDLKTPEGARVSVR